MTKYLVLPMLFCIVLQGCQPAPEDICQDPSGNCSETTNPVDPLPEPGADVPPEAALFETNTNYVNFSSADQEKVEKALGIIKSVIRTSEFRDRVLNFNYEGQNRFVDSDLSPEEIYQSLIDGSETLAPGIDHEMDLNLELYYSPTNTVGYTYPDVLTIWMNRKYFDSYTPSQVAGNIFHEWTHKLGYDHASRYSVRRDSSVPYALGYMMEELGLELEE